MPSNSELPATAQTHHQWRADISSVGLWEVTHQIRVDVHGERAASRSGAESGSTRPVSWQFHRGIGETRSRACAKDDVGVASGSGRIATGAPLPVQIRRQVLDQRDRRQHACCREADGDIRLGEVLSVLAETPHGLQVIDQQRGCLGDVPALAPYAIRSGDQAKDTALQAGAAR